MLSRRAWDPRIGPLQVATLRRVLEREGMVTAWWSDVPGAKLPVHAHAFPETRWIVEGTVSGMLTGSNCFMVGSRRV